MLRFLPSSAALTILFLLGIPLLNPQTAKADESGVVPASAALEIGIDDQAFAVVQRIYQSETSDPVAQHRLLFDGGVIYDLPEIQTRIVTVYDPAKKQVILIDRQAKNQTSISTTKLVEFTANVKAGSANPSDLGIGTVVRPSDRVDGYTAEFSNTDDAKHFGVRYDVTTQTVHSHTMAKDFGRFSDLSSRLSLLRRRGLPPFARMSLSRKLSSLGVLPSETTLTVQRGDHSEHFKSTTTVESFTKKDGESINQVRGMIASYESVAMNEFTTE
ncbi:hypothetical protein [Rubripirellula obstinata]|nr:hypothetical protein [Rubripirellula obstinata]